MSLKNLNFKQVSVEDNLFLTTVFSKEEIKMAVWDCEDLKSPGPDGITFDFIKDFWDSIKGDFVRFISEFHDRRHIVRGENNSFIILIPKKASPQRIGDFRPISLIRCMYKVLSKILANRLRKVLPNIISENQTAFVKGIQILDGILIENELVDKAKKKGKKTMLFKVDFEKAFDSVNWNYLQEMMQFMGFCCKWRKWIEECLQSASISVLVNGSSTREFRVGRGLRQGDPYPHSYF